MQTPPNRASVSPAPESRVQSNARRVDDVVYQLVTAAAILLVLGSLWVF
ncbi:MAG TPA: hypothetical protein VKB38_06425 [Terracidiphilus sp.]|nr:hypothetical protein [Terracidiphilus sp.]